MATTRTFSLIIGNDRVSELHVMKSAAGYYIGRTYLDAECGDCEFPYSRESAYMTQSEAGEALATMNFTVRDCIENNASYSNNELPDIRTECNEAQEEFHAWSQACDDDELADQERWDYDAERDNIDGCVPF